MPRPRLRQVSLLIILKKGLIVRNTDTCHRICIIYFFVFFTKYCHSELIKREMKSHSTLLVGKPEGKGHLVDLGVNGRILKSVLKEYIVWVWAADKWWALVNTVTKLLGAYKSGHVQEPEHVSL